MIHKEKIISIIDGVNNIVFIVLLVVIPFIFWNVTTEFFDTPKLIFLFVVDILLLFLWTIKSLINGKVSIRRTPLDLPLLVFIGAAIISTFLSSAKWISILGDLPNVSGSLITFILFALTYFLVVSNIKKTHALKNINLILIVISILLSVLSILYYCGLYIIPINFTKVINFTPTGSSFSSNSILILTLPFLLLSILRDQKNDNSLNSEKNLLQNKLNLTNSIFLKLMLSLITSLLLTNIIITGSIPIYIVTVIVFMIVFFITPSNQLKRNFSFLSIPIFIVFFLGIFSLISITKQNILFNRYQIFPREINLPVSDSWKISISAFRDYPFLGTGPGSFHTDFSNYKPVSFNTNPFWNYQFREASNEYLEILAVLGSIGFIALLSLTFIYLSKSIQILNTKSNNLNISLAISGIMFFVLLAIHVETITLMIFGIIILALFMVFNNELTEEIQVGIAAIKKDKDQSYLRFDLLPLILLIITTFFIIACAYYGTKYTIADYYHRQALNQINNNKPLNAYEELVKAESLNPHAALYRTDIAQVNLALANAIVNSKGPTKASPSGSLTNQDKQNIQTFLSQAINEGKMSVALDPNSPSNWEVLGNIYRQISGVTKNALAFSLDSYGQAIKLDPYNPSLRLTIGGIYYSIKNYNMAINFFTDAVNLKPDYANAYYNLAIALRDNGDIPSAINATQRLMQLVKPNSQDYKVASTLLTELNNKSLDTKQQKSTQSANLSPAAENTSALSKTNLQNVLSLPKDNHLASPSSYTTTIK